MAWPTPFFFVGKMDRLLYTLRGVKRRENEAGSERRARLPVTPAILKKLQSVWESSASDPDTVMVWAACCLDFFCFLRSGEMCVPDDRSFDPSVHLTRDDIAVDDTHSPSIIRVSIKQSKTDPFRRGVNLSMLNYLAVRGSSHGPLFMFRDGRFLTRERLVAALRSASSKAGVDPSKFCGHSFRIGAATTAAANGVEDAIIKTLGRWRSLAYLDYVKIPRQQLAFYSRVLCS